MLDVITIGDSSQDIFLVLDPANTHLHNLRHEQKEIGFTYADKIPVLKKYDCVGGNAANAATAFARLGFNTAIYTQLGQDETGERIMKEFQKNKLKTDYVSFDPHVSSNYNTALSLDGERTILVYHQPRQYVFPKMAAAKLIYFTSMNSGFENILDHLTGYIQEHRALLCFQPGTFQLKAGPEQVKSLLKSTYLIVMNKEEAERYLTLPPGQEIKTLLKGLHSLGPQIALITDGENGAFSSDGRKSWHLPIIPNINKVDTTGAGDSFAAGFSAGILNGLPIKEALLWGQFESSSVIQQFGAQAGLLFWKQLQDFKEQYPDLEAVSI